MSKIRKSGGYRQLASFQTSTTIYDATYWFCEKFLDPRSRTVDQMIQAARSGRQNIAEGSRAAATSSQTELRLVNVARSSLEELLLDYEDYLRHRRHQLWPADSPQAKAVRSVPQQYRQAHPHSPLFTKLQDHERWALYSPWLDSGEPAIRANAVICLIHQANFLLDQQIAALENQFITEGGYSEQLAAARLAQRQRVRTDRTDRSDRSDRSNPTDQSNPTDHIPTCPKCGKLMALRTAKQGKYAGQSFWGCTGYPDCRETAPV